MDCFVACRPGLEPLLVDELGELAIPALQRVPGGVAFVGDEVHLARANLELGVASHVLVRVGRFEARHFSELVRRAKGLPWERFVPRDAPLELRVTSKRSRLFHTGAIAQRVVEAIDAALGGARPTTGEPLPIVVRLERDLCELSVDTSGAPLHRRGWRLQTAKAPLREDLAWALLRASGWDRNSPLLDPMMGSGTLVIEAAAMARGLAPGRDRTFALERLPMFDAAILASVRAAARERIRERLPFAIHGRDAHPGALAAARSNAERAGVLDDLQLARADVRREALPSVATVVCNPPYGQRIGGAEVVALYRALGAAIHEISPPPRVALVTSERALASACGLPLRPALLTDHGGTKVEFYVGGGPAAGD